MQVRLKDIAEEVGLSVPVVSKVLNSSRGTSAASPQAAALIRETAERMGYTRNRAAAALKKGGHQTIGVLLHPMGAPGSEMTPTILEGISQQLAKHDQRMELGFYHTKDEFHALLRRMGPTSVDGLIVAGRPHEELCESLDELAQAGRPMVSIQSRSTSENVPNAQCDESELLRLTTAHLIAQGCRRIAQIALWPQRSEGYVQALREAGLPIHEELIYWTTRTDFSPQIGEDGVASLKYRGVDFDGLVCQADIFALGAMRAILQHEHRIPEDIKIIGVDNSPYCQFTPIPLSSVSLELFERGRLAVDMLMRIEDGQNVSSQSVTPKLVPRASTCGRGKNIVSDFLKS